VEGDGEADLAAEVLAPPSGLADSPTSSDAEHAATKRAATATPVRVKSVRIPILLRGAMLEQLPFQGRTRARVEKIQATAAIGMDGGAIDVITCRRCSPEGGHGQSATGVPLRLVAKRLIEAKRDSIEAFLRFGPTSSRCSSRPPDVDDGLRM